jgi:hypothetical protein
MADYTNTILNAIMTHLLETGEFNSVTQHEALTATVSGINTSVVVSGQTPVASYSGLASTSVVVAIKQILYVNMTVDLETIDSRLMDATDACMRLYMGDIELADGIEVDALGITGVPLRAIYGYMNIQKIVHRIVTVDISVIVTNEWEQVR